MAISYHELSDTSYAALRFLVIKNTENAKPKPYFDGPRNAREVIGVRVDFGRRRDRL
jgi:hypothetical protein